MNNIFTHSFETKLGTIRTASTVKGLAFVSIPNESKRIFQTRIKKYYPEYTVLEGGKINKDTEKQINKYLNGKLTTFTIPLDMSGTDFQLKVLKKVASIPYGKTKTYAQIAKAAGSPKAYRAVGSANAKNNLPIIIPCHRVVASNGFGGYAGGIEMKINLLKLEQKTANNNLK